MKSELKEKMIKVRNSSRAAKETNDCALYSAALAFDIDYDVFRRVINGLGRRHRDGTRMALWHRAIELLGGKFSRVTEYFRTVDEPGFRNGIKTVGSFLRYVNHKRHANDRGRKTYVIVTTTHMTVVRDGYLLDTGWCREGSRAAIKAVYQVWR